MSVERDIRYELIARLCPNATGAELRSVCTEAGMYAIRARRKLATEKDFLEAVNKVIKGYQKFSSTPKVFRFLSYCKIKILTLLFLVYDVELDLLVNKSRTYRYWKYMHIIRLMRNNLVSSFL